MIVASARTSRLAFARAASRSSRPRIVSRMTAPNSSMNCGVRPPGIARSRTPAPRSNAASSASGTGAGRRHCGAPARPPARCGRRGRAAGSRGRAAGGAGAPPAPASSPATARSPSRCGSAGNGRAVLRPRKQRAFAQDRRRVVGRDVRGRRAASGGLDAQRVAGDAQLVAGGQRMVAAACRPARPFTITGTVVPWSRTQKRPSLEHDERVRARDDAVRIRQQQRALRRAADRARPSRRTSAVTGGSTATSL